MSAGQMIDDIKLSVFNARCNRPVEFFGRMGGILPGPDEVLAALESKLIKE